MAKGSKWAQLKQQYPKLPLDADYQAKIEAILNAPIPPDDRVAMGDYPLDCDDPLRAADVNSVVRFYNLLRDDIEALENQVSTLNAKLEACEFLIQEQFDANEWLTMKFDDGSSITVSPEPVISVEDEQAFYAWVKQDPQRQSDFKLREYVMPATAKAQVKKLLEADIKAQVPGVKVFHLNKLSRRSG